MPETEAAFRKVEQGEFGVAFAIGQLSPEAERGGPYRCERSKSLVPRHCHRSSLICFLQALCSRVIKTTENIRRRKSKGSCAISFIGLIPGLDRVIAAIGISSLCL